MNATQAKKALARVAAKHGARLEEDFGLRDMRTFQLVAPPGKLWDEGIMCMRVEICSTRTSHSFKYNLSEVRNAEDRASYGIRDMREDEKELYAED